MGIQMKLFHYVLTYFTATYIHVLRNTAYILYVIVSHIILWDAVVHPCVGRLLLGPGPSCVQCAWLYNISFMSVAR